MSSKPPDVVAISERFIKHYCCSDTWYCCPQSDSADGTQGYERRMSEFNTPYYNEKYTQSQKETLARQCDCGCEKDRAKLEDAIKLYAQAILDAERATITSLSGHTEALELIAPINAVIFQEGNEFMATWLGPNQHMTGETIAQAVDGLIDIVVLGFIAYEKADAEGRLGRPAADEYREMKRYIRRKV